MVYELDELLFRVYMCSNIFVRTHFLFCFIKANNGFVQLIYIQLLNFDSRLIISSYSLCFLTIEISGSLKRAIFETDKQHRTMFYNVAIHKQSFGWSYPFN